MRKLEEVTILRAIACLAVVMVHISAFVIFSGNVGKPVAAALSFVNALSVFAVPTFLVISGYTLTYQYADRKLDLGEFYIKRFSRVLVPYIFWTCVYYAAFVLQGIYQLSPKVLLENLVLGNMVYHLYFVVLLAQFYLFFGVFRYIWSRFNSWLMLLVFLAINIIFMRFASFMFMDRVFLRYVFFFALGGYMALHRKQVLTFLQKKIVRRSLGIGYLLMSVWMAIRYFQKFILQQPYDTFTEDMYWLLYCTVALLLYWSISQFLALRAFEPAKKLISRISQASFYIYLAHPLALYLAQFILNRIPTAPTVFKLILTLGLVLGVVFPLAILYSEKREASRKKPSSGSDGRKVKAKSKKKWFLLLLIVIILIAVSFVVRGFKKDITGSSYQGEGFIFKLPEEYQQTEGQNDEIVLSFQSPTSTIKVYAQPTDHLLSSISYIAYSNEQLVQGKAGFKLMEDQTGMANWKATRRFAYNRPVLTNLPNDRNYYREINVIDPLNSRVITFWGKTTQANDKNLEADLQAAAESYSWNGDSAFTPQPQFSEPASPHVKYQGKRLSLDIPPGEMVWGRFFPGYPNKPEATLDLEKSEEEFAHKFEFVMDYKTFLIGDPFPLEAAMKANEDGRVLMLTLQPFSSDLNWIAIPDIIEGKHDEEIRAWAEGFKEVGEPIFVRPLNEMNGDWDPWCAWFFGKDTELYNLAWRHMVDIFREVGADNAYFVWNPHDRSYPDFLWNNSHLYYPGDEYVDWVGLTGYNNGISHEGDVWREFDEIYEPIYADYLQRYADKPFMITEFSCNEAGGNKAQWIERGMASLAKNYGNIKIATWFDSQDNLWLYQLDSSPEAWNAFRNGLKDNDYYTGAVELKN